MERGAEKFMLPLNYSLSHVSSPQEWYPPPSPNSVFSQFRYNKWVSNLPSAGADCRARIVSYISLHLLECLPAILNGLRREGPPSWFTNKGYWSCGRWCPGARGWSSGHRLTCRSRSRSWQRWSWRGRCGRWRTLSGGSPPPSGPWASTPEPWKQQSNRWMTATKTWAVSITPAVFTASVNIGD